MLLQDLSLDVIKLIAEAILDVVGIREATRLRLICKRFDDVLQSAIYSLPTFENEDDQSPDILTRDPRMSRTMTSRLILAKLGRGDAEGRPLCSAINQATDLLARNSQGNSAAFNGTECRYALAKAAADSLFLQDIVSHLSLKRDAPSPVGQPLESALVAAASTNRLHDARYLLGIGVKASTTARFFGSAIEAAARLGFEEMMELFLSETQTHIEFRSLMDALEAAAAAGQEHIVRMLIYRDKSLQADPSYDDAIKRALRANHESVAMILLQFRRAISKTTGTSISVDESNFEFVMLRTAAECGCENTVRSLLDTDGVCLREKCITSPIEDATRHGHANIVRYLLSKKLGPICYTGPLYWAAYYGSQEIVELLLHDMGTLSLCALSDALAGAASNMQLGIMRYLLIERVTRPETVQAPVKHIVSGGFATALHLLLDSNPERSAMGFNYVPSVRPQPSVNQTAATVDNMSSYVPPDPSLPLPQEPQLLEEACEMGQVDRARAILSGFISRSPNHALDIFGGSCCVAAKANRPGLLYYICQYIPPYLVPQTALQSRSTAIIRVFLDLGWKINKPLDRASPPLLGHVVEDEFLARWLLKCGADPNGRCDWGYTPMTFAVFDASLVTIKLLFHYGGNAKRGQLLHFAARRRQSDVCEVMDLLLKLGAHINAIEFENEPAGWVENKFFGLGTPLHYAAELGRHDVVSFLLSKGADRSKKDSLGRTAFDLAQTKGHQEVAEHLRDYR